MAGAGERRASRRTAERTARGAGAARGTGASAAHVLARLRGLGSARHRDGLARYAIPSERAFGVPTGPLRALAQDLGRDHALALELWKSGWLEARVLATFVAEPGRLTPATMDRWCRDFDNWAVCDAACWDLFDRTPHAFDKVREWSGREREYERRAAFALLAGLALHDRVTPDRPFERCLPVCARAASDPRNFVKKGVVWALRQIGLRSEGLHARVRALAGRLTESRDATERWVGRNVLRELSTPAAQRRLGARTERDRRARERTPARPTVRRR